MIKCGASPVRQGTNWRVFFMAATHTFKPHMALLLQHLMNLKPLLTVSRWVVTRQSLGP